MPTHRENLRRLSVSQLVEITGMAARTITTRLRAAGLEPAATDGRTTRYDPRVVLPVLFEAASPQAERARLDAARAEAQEMKNSVMRGALLHFDEVSHIGTEILHVVRNRVMQIVTLTAAIRASASIAEGAEILEGGAREALAELSKLGDLATLAAGKVPADDDVLDAEPGEEGA